MVMMQMTQLTTNRLQFRQWTNADFPVFREFYANPVASKFVGGTKQPEEAWRNMARYVGHYHLKGYTLLALVEKQTGAVAGAMGLWNSEPWPELELGYWLLPAMQGKGYATEGATAVHNYAFNELKVPTLVSYIDPSNTASINVATKVGAVPDGTTQLAHFGTVTVYRYPGPG